MYNELSLSLSLHPFLSSTTRLEREREWLTNVAEQKVMIENMNMGGWGKWENTLLSLSHPPAVTVTTHVRVTTKRLGNGGERHPRVLALVRDA
jgi:hypothetical protein